MLHDLDNIEMISTRNASIISAYTGVLLGEFSDMHKYIEEIMGRPVFTHELADENIVNEIKEKAKQDFFNIVVRSEGKNKMKNKFNFRLNMECFDIPLEEHSTHDVLYTAEKDTDLHDIYRISWGEGDDWKYINYETKDVEESLNKKEWIMV